MSCNKLRKIYSPEQLRAFRLLLSALQKEEVYLKHNQENSKKSFTSNRFTHWEANKRDFPRD